MLKTNSLWHHWAQDSLSIWEDVLSPATETLVGPGNFSEETTEKELEEKSFPKCIEQLTHPKFAMKKNKPNL